jgi:hypothetical protein
MFGNLRIKITKRESGTKATKTHAFLPWRTRTWRINQLFFCFWTLAATFFWQALINKPKSWHHRRSTFGCACFVRSVRDFIYVHHFQHLFSRTRFALRRLLQSLIFFICSKHLLVVFESAVRCVGLAFLDQFIVAPIFGFGIFSSTVLLCF